MRRQPLAVATRSADVGSGKMIILNVSHSVNLFRNAYRTVVEFAGHIEGSLRDGRRLDRKSEGSLGTQLVKSERYGITVLAWT